VQDPYHTVRTTKTFALRCHHQSNQGGILDHCVQIISPQLRLFLAFLSVCSRFVVCLDLLDEYMQALKYFYRGRGGHAYRPQPAPSMLERLLTCYPVRESSFQSPTRSTRYLKLSTLPFFTWWRGSWQGRVTSSNAKRSTKD
jgi:hypothetical protein